MTEDDNDLLWMDEVNGTKQNSTVAGRPWHLWVVAILAFLWNSIGGLDFFMTQTENVAYFENAGFTAEQMRFFTFRCRCH